MGEHLSVSCPKCGHAYKMSAEKAGQKARCRCGHVWVLPRRAAASATDHTAELAAGPVQTGANEHAASPQGAEPVAVKPEAVPAEAAQAAPAAEFVPMARPVEREAAAEEAAVEAPSARSIREKEEARKLLGRELGTFRIEELLGVGGFGTVYRAFDKSLHRDVAVKVLPAGMLRAGKEKVQQFLLEARAAAKLSHPNIVTVHQICQSDGIYFIVMELVEGRSLADIVKMRRLTPREATRIITDATRALAHAHKRGLIHRDVKPGNIIVTRDGLVKVTDFGLARDIFRNTEDEEFGRAVGTPLYMSPEQCEGEEGDSRSDVYSMGATYYVALTRRPPYEGRNTEEIMNRHRADPPPDPRAAVPGLPAAVFRTIEKAMAKDPAERYQTAVELLQALETLNLAALDPKAGLDLQTVSAQISAVTPGVGEHVGAVIKDALRHADTSKTGSRLLDMIERASPMKWWLLAGGVVIVMCIAMVIVALVFALGPREEPPPAPPLEAGHPAPVAPAVQPRAKPSAEVKPQAEPSPGTQAPAPVATPPESQSSATPEAEPTSVKPEDQPTDTAAQPEETQSKTEVPLEAAKATYEEAQAWEKEAWATDPASVYDKYENVARYYPNTPYAEKAKADIERLQKEAEQPPVPADTETTPPKPEESKPPAKAPQEPTRPAKDQKTPTKDPKAPTKDQKTPAKK